jgi:hypothetical protein
MFKQQPVQTKRPAPLAKRHPSVKSEVGLETSNTSVFSEYIEAPRDCETCARQKRQAVATHEPEDRSKLHSEQSFSSESLRNVGIVHCQFDKEGL